MIADFENGGLRFPDFRSKLKSVKIAWIQRLFDDSVQTWKQCLDVELKKNTMLYINTAPESKDLPPHLSEFYVQIFSIWHDILH